MLRRAFSIARFRHDDSKVHIDVIYRVVGTATRWMASLGDGDEVSVLGPLGNQFPIDPRKSQAWLVAGGVGLPPMLWLAEALHGARKATIAFCGAQRHDLLALTMDQQCLPDPRAESARASALEFKERGAQVIVSTDDGSLGYKGHIGQALEAFSKACPPVASDLVVYTCGPERMMHFVAEFCKLRGITCYACLERNMACGLGTCQSCAVPAPDEKAADGWAYRLCCTDGPVFDAGAVIWT